jgi:hypothetical protein
MMTLGNILSRAANLVQGDKVSSGGGLFSRLPVSSCLFLQGHPLPDAEHLADGIIHAFSFDVAGDLWWREWVHLDLSSPLPRAFYLLFPRVSFCRSVTLPVVSSSALSRS